MLSFQTRLLALLHLLFLLLSTVFNVHSLLFSPPCAYKGTDVILIFFSQPLSFSFLPVHYFLKSVLCPLLWSVFPSLTASFHSIRIFQYPISHMRYFVSIKGIIYELYVLCVFVRFSVCSCRDKYTFFYNFKRNIETNCENNHFCIFWEHKI